MSHIPAPETLNLANVLHLLPHGYFLEFWTHVGVMSHIPARETLNLANVIHLLPQRYFLEFWTHVGVMSHVPTPVTPYLADVLLYPLHGCFLQLLDSFLHSFFLMSHHLL